ncbi:hypothetical protein [Microbacterium sp. XT11]|uniref:hypothetical protein n=1 Tax=Microbacterium sp. XT11 TaxID=367477 RepID=UPI0008374170|nr:hypothetical protein [Microbacterium sp. XT11]
MTSPRSHLLRADLNQRDGDAPASTEDVYRPNVPVRVRDAVYWTTLATAAASALASGVAGIWFPDIAPQVLATGGVATTVMGIIGGGVGVVYRPSASR